MASYDSFCYSSGCVIVWWLLHSIVPYNLRLRAVIGDSFDVDFQVDYVELLEGAEPRHPKHLIDIARLSLADNTVSFRENAESLVHLGLNILV